MFEHVSVLKEQAVEGLNIKADGVYVDCTLGGGGHALAIAERLGPNGKLIAFDQDIHAMQAAKERLTDHKDKIIFVEDNFRNLNTNLQRLGLEHTDGFLFDLGVSSPQFDVKERGFSYQNEAPLDMRMNQSQQLSAFHVVNEWSYNDLVSIFFRYGEEKFSKQIARKIEERRKKGPITTTDELAELIKAGIPAAARRTGGHPAKRVFQAIRIAVNDELNVFKEALQQAAETVNVGGRISVITFHSLEDRICKQAFKKWSSLPPLPRNIPYVPEETKPPFKQITKKPILAEEDELESNRRARSAKLRIIEKERPWKNEFSYNEGWK